MCYLRVHEPLYIYILPDIDIARGSFVKKEMASASDLFGAAKSGQSFHDVLTLAMNRTDAIIDGDGY